jgi:hypothetical protein
MAYVLAFWRLAADMEMTRDAAQQGLLSHWQLWFTVAAGLHLVARTLSRKLDAQKSTLS